MRPNNVMATKDIAAEYKEHPERIAEVQWITITEHYRASDASRIQQMEMSKQYYQAEIKILIDCLKELRSNSRLWKSGGIGGQDQYAGLPPAMRHIDEAFSKLSVNTKAQHET